MVTKPYPNMMQRVAWTFPTVAAMIAETRLRTGDIVCTTGYYTSGDGGGAMYNIVNAATGTDDGGSYIDLVGSSKQAALMEQDTYCPKQWGAKGDGVTDDKAAIEAMLDYTALLGADPYAHLTDVENNNFPRPITITGSNGLYAVSGQITLAKENSGHRFVNINFKAIAGTWETAGGTPTSQRQDYRPQKSEHFFRAAANATFITFDTCNFYCENLCGGVALRARSRVHNCYIKTCAGVGVRALAGDVWVDLCQIDQWLQNDVEYYDRDAYTGIGVLAEDSDMRVTNCVIRWLHELVRFESTNCHVWGGHLFNGCNAYNASDRVTTSELAAAMVAYFPAIADEAAAIAYDFPERTYNAGVVFDASVNADGSLNQVYFDNCHNEFYSDRIVIVDTKLGQKSGATFGSMRDYWFKFYCHTNGATPQLRIFNIQNQVQTGSKTKTIEFAAHNGNSWNVNYTAFENATVNSPVSPYLDGYSVSYPHVQVCTGGNGQEPIIGFYAPAAGAGIGFADINTSVDGGGVPLWSRVIALGDNLQVRSDDFLMVSQDGSTTKFRARSDGSFQFQLLDAEPADANNGSIAVSDGTSSTNGFGVSGAGLYLKLAGSWAKL